MAGKSLTVSSLISQVRSMLDEDNTATVNTNTDIIPALNRAQDYAANILSRHYESPMLKYTEVTPVSGKSEYPTPEDAFEDRIEKIEVRNNNQYYPLTRINYRDISLYETDSPVPIPSYYTIVGDKYRIIPASSGAYPFRVWYLEDPLPLVEEQGRVTKVDSSGNYILVDSVGDSLTSEVDNLNSYVNIIDGQSGKLKATLQIKNIVDTKILFKTIPSRDTVQGLSVSNNISALTDSYGNTVEIELDDYICVAAGTCIPLFKKPFTNFLIQYAVAEIRRKLGQPADIELRVKKELEDQVERSWVGREEYLRVKLSSNKWTRLTRRFWRN